MTWKARIKELPQALASWARARDSSTGQTEESHGSTFMKLANGENVHVMHGIASWKQNKEWECLHGDMSIRRCLVRHARKWAWSWVLCPGEASVVLQQRHGAAQQEKVHCAQQGVPRIYHRLGLAHGPHPASQQVRGLGCTLGRTPVCSAGVPIAALVSEDFPGRF